MDFKLKGPKLGDLDLPRIGHQIGVGEDIIHGVFDVETSGRSTDSKGRLNMLFEPHVFDRNLSGAARTRARREGLAYPDWKRDYPADSYPRLLKAMKINQTAALKACSWGFPQILGENHALAGFATPQAMVKAMTTGEAAQLQAMVSFIVSAGLDDELRVLEAKLQRGQTITPDDCRPFVRGYNGKSYEKNEYHRKFANALNKWAKIPDTPWTADNAISYDGSYQEAIETVQRQLNDLGYPEVGTFDGRWGSKTRAAVLAFRADNELPLVASIDDEMLAALVLAGPREIAEERKNATVDDLRQREAKDVQAADKTEVAGYVATGTGAVVAAEKVGVFESLKDFSGVAEPISNALLPFRDIFVDNFWLIMIGVGGVVIWQSGVLKRIRLDKHQTGKDVSR